MKKINLVQFFILILIFVAGVMAGNALTIHPDKENNNIDDGRIVCSKAMEKYYKKRMQELSKNETYYHEEKLMKISQTLENSRY